MGVWGFFPLTTLLVWLALICNTSIQAHNNIIDNGTALSNAASQQFVFLKNACQAYGRANTASIVSVPVTVTVAELQPYTTSSSVISDMITTLNFKCILQQSSSVNYAASIGQLTLYDTGIAYQFQGNTNTNLAYSTSAQMNANIEVNLATGLLQASSIPIASLNTPLQTAYDPSTTNYAPGFAIEIIAL